jgi:hypothetical protein
MKEQIQQKIEEWIGEDIELRDRSDSLPNAYHFLKGKNELKQDLRTKAPQLAQEIVDMVVEEVRNHPAFKALSDYQQADYDGVMVLVSRQAIEETKQLINNLNK